MLCTLTAIAPHVVTLSYPVTLASGVGPVGEPSSPYTRLTGAGIIGFVVREAYGMCHDETRACGGAAVPDEWMANSSATARRRDARSCVTL